MQLILTCAKCRAELDSRMERGCVVVEPCQCTQEEGCEQNFSFKPASNSRNELIALMLKGMRGINGGAA